MQEIIRKQFAKWASQKFRKVDLLCMFPRLFQTAEITTDNRDIWVNFSITTSSGLFMIQLSYELDFCLENRISSYNII